MAEQTVTPIHLHRRGFALAPELATLRAEHPVARLTLASGAKAWLVTRHDLIREVLSHPARFGNDGRYITDPAGGGAVAATGPALRHGDLLTYDPPEHGRLRRVISAGFTARRIQSLRPRVVSIVASVLDTMEAVGPPANLVSAFALPIPSMIICELLGIPYQDRASFQQRAVVRLDTSCDPAIRAGVVAESVAYMKSLVRDQRSRPGDGLLGLLIREHGAEIDDRELAGVGDLLLLGGHETTANMLALGTLLLLQHPEQVTLTKDEPMMTSLVEELLRYLSIAQTGVARIARVDSSIGGQQIRRGERILCSLPSGNHDDALVANADQFDPTRDNNAHLAFGHGIHYCIGAALARLEISVALPALLSRFPGLRVTREIDDIEFRSASAIYGAQEIPIAW